jgi:hypothetical protein
MSSTERFNSWGAQMIADRVKLGIIGLTFIAITPAGQTNAWADGAGKASARLRILEKEIAAIKQENEARRRVNKLREQNVALVKQTGSTTHAWPSCQLQLAAIAAKPMRPTLSVDGRAGTSPVRKPSATDEGGSNGVYPCGPPPRRSQAQARLRGCGPKHD